MRRKITKSKIFFIKVLVSQKIFNFGKKLFQTILIRKPAIIHSFAKFQIIIQKNKKTLIFDKNNLNEKKNNYFQSLF